jgi:hypothetical protein
MSLGQLKSAVRRQAVATGDMPTCERLSGLICRPWLFSSIQCRQREGFISDSEQKMGNSEVLCIAPGQIETGLTVGDWGTTLG